MRRFLKSAFFSFVALIHYAPAAYSETVISIVDLHDVSAEFRLCEGRKCGGQKWFVSFLSRKDLQNGVTVMGLDVSKIKINGTFHHGNLGGESFGLSDGTQANEALDAANALRPLFSIWDSVLCKKGELRLMRAQDTYFLEASGLGECYTEPND